MKKIKNLTQEYDWDCGVAVVRTAINHLTGKVISHKRTAKACGSREDYGTQFRMLETGIKKLSKKLDVKAYLKVKPAELIVWNRDPNTILIVDWWDASDGHFSIVADVKVDFISLVDPQFYSLRTLPMDMFITNWFDWDGTWWEKNWLDRGLVKVTKL